MDREFLEGLGLSNEQADAILSKTAETKLDERLKAEGILSVSAARGVLAENGTDTKDTDLAVTYLKENHGYLFASAEPVFTGPAGGDKGTDDSALRRALGII